MASCGPVALPDNQPVVCLLHLCRCCGTFHILEAWRVQKTLDILRPLVALLPVVHTRGRLRYSRRVGGVKVARERESWDPVLNWRLCPLHKAAGTKCHEPCWPNSSYQSENPALIERPIVFNSVAEALLWITVQWGWHWGADTRESQWAYQHSFIHLALLFNVPQNSTALCMSFGTSLPL